MEAEENQNFFHLFDPVKDSLWFAARKGDTKSVESFLEQGHHPDGEGRLNPLCGATHEGHIEVMKILLQAGADVNKAGVTRLSAINFSVSNAEAMALLLQYGADIQGLSLTHLSTRCKKDIIDLLTAVFDPVKDSLWFATRRGDAQSVESLLKQGHNPDGEGQLNPLCGASYEGHLDIVSRLLKAGANVNKTGIYGVTAIHHALHSPEVVTLLLQYGANISGLDMDHVSKTANNDVLQLLSGAVHFQKASQSHSLNTINLQWSKKEIQALVESVTSRVLFMGECMIGKTSLVRKLLDRNSKLTDQDERTVVAELNHWVLDGGKKVISLVDIGGHRSYQSSGHYFHCNAVNNTSIICHDIVSNNYYQTLTWIKSVLTRSPKCNVIIVLTKCDQLDKIAIDQKLTLFITEMKKLVLEEIKSLNVSIAISKKRKSEQIHRLCELRSKYQFLADKLPELTVVTSCVEGYESTINRLVTQIMKITDDNLNRIQLPEHYQKFYIALGKLGVRLPRSKLQDTSNEENQNTANDKQSELDNKANGMKTTIDEMSELKLNDHKKDQTFEKGNLKDIAPLPLQYVSFQEAKQIYKDILIKYGLDQVNIDESLSLCLECLHKHGLLMYFTGNKELEQIIFNDMKSFIEILQCVFHHDAMTSHNFSDISADLQYDVYDNNEQKYLNDVKMFHKQGLLSYSLLNVLLANNNCDIDPKVVMQLLAVLEVGFIFTPSKEHTEHLFIPYHVSGKEIPEFLKEEFRNICERDTISIKGYIAGNLPDTFWNYILVRLFKHQHSQMQSKYVWQNGFWTTLGKQNVQILLTYNGKNQIDFTVKGNIKDIEGHNLIWKLIQYIDDECDRLSFNWWPGLITRKIIICTHCVLMNIKEPSEWCLSQIFSDYLALDMETFCCETNPGYAVPLSVIMPLPEDLRLAKKMCDAGRKYINENIDLSGNFDIDEDFDSVEDVFHYIADNLHHKYFSEVARNLGYTAVQIDDMECHFRNSNKPQRDLRFALLQQFQQKQGEESFDLDQVADSIKAVGGLERLAQQVKIMVGKIKGICKKCESKIQK